MKRQVTALFLVTILGAIGAGTPDKFRAPSDLYIKGYSTPIGVDFVLRQIADLRKVYCDVDTIKDREQRRVCLLDSKLGEWHQEVAIPTNATLNGVLSSIGFTNWNGGRQIRIIRKDAILQSGFPRAIGSTTWRLFLDVTIAPADIIILCPREG
jgi:hypothetical protein